MSCWTKQELENMLFDVVDALDLSELMIEKHGPWGTAPAELVRQVLAQKNLQIECLRRGFIEIQQPPNNTNLMVNAMLSDEQIDKYLEMVLLASGSSLKYYSLQKPKDDMRTAMRLVEKAVLESRGSDEAVGKCFEVVQLKTMNYDTGKHLRGIDSLKVGDKLYLHPSKPAVAPEIVYKEGWKTGWADRHATIDNDSRVRLMPTASLNDDWANSDARKLLSQSTAEKECE